MFITIHPHGGSAHGAGQDLPKSLEAASAESVGSPAFTAHPTKIFHQGKPILGLEEEGWKLLAHSRLGLVTSQVNR